MNPHPLILTKSQPNHPKVILHCHHGEKEKMGRKEERGRNEKRGGTRRTGEEEEQGRNEK